MQIDKKCMYWRKKKKWIKVRFIFPVAMHLSNINHVTSCTYIYIIIISLEGGTEQILLICMLTQLTLSQTTHFRLFQTESVCRRQFRF